MEEQILNFLETNFKEEKVLEMLDEEILEWVDNGWEEECESEYDWYVDYRNKEAEDVIRQNLIEAIKRNIPNIPNDVDLIEIIKEKYDCLNY